MNRSVRRQILHLEVDLVCFPALPYLVHFVYTNVKLSLLVDIDEFFLTNAKFDDLDLDVLLQ